MTKYVIQLEEYINGREKVRAALIIYDCEVSLIDRIISKKTDVEWDCLVSQWTEFAKSKDHKNIAGVIIANIEMNISEYLR